MWYVDGVVAVLELLLTLVGLPQQLLGCWWLSRFRSSSLPGVFVDYYVYGLLGCVGVDAQLLLVSSTSAGAVASAKP